MCVRSHRRKQLTHSGYLPIKKVIIIPRKNQRFYQLFLGGCTNFSILPKDIPYFIYYAKTRKLKNFFCKRSRAGVKKRKMRKKRCFEKKRALNATGFLMKWVKCDKVHKK
jgi:hypothetical protein